MSERATSLLHILVFMALSIALQSSVSHGTPTTTILDVSASIQMTLDILSFKLPEEPSSKSSVVSPSITCPFSISLFHRSSIFYSQFSNYESIVLSRLARDAARVSSILARINPSDATSSSKSFSALVTSGVSYGSGEYFARIGIGHPVKNYYWVIDTGSDVNWLQCLPCDSCYEQSDPIYDPSTSSTYRSLSCESAQCQSLNNPSCVSNSCQYQVSYGDGSFTYGDFATDTLSFDSASVSNLSIGCGHDNEGQLEGSAGIIGLGGGTLSLPSQLKAKTFSYCLVDRDSTGFSTLEFDSGQLRNSVTTRLVQNTREKTFRYLQIVDLSVGGRRLGISSSLFAVDSSGRGGTIIDSGTTVTRLTNQAYIALRNEFVRQARYLQRTSGYEEIFDTCYSLSSSRTSVSIPTVSFNFPGNQILELPARNILIPVNSEGKFCLAFLGTDSSLSIIGNIQQQTIRVNFDLANSVVQFSPKQC